ncbi:hypothetical protein VM1G_08118 [Cytospora mali]|uniref:non-specific serine/threonine protein kinase n=1 Tax=Cytospora mali TaxID=578113 RepID=A0A194W910_CYTMA|nr:hypothetical protein VM1G_08118 [Valsa mali]
MADLPECFQPQTLDEFVTSYNHIAMRHLASPAATQVNRTTATKGAITNPEGRLAPERIEPWNDFDREQERGIIATVLREARRIGGDALNFPAQYYVDRVGEDLGIIDSENALLFFDSDTFHKPATRILRSLLANDRIKLALARRQQQQHANARQRDQSRFAYRSGKVSFSTHLNRLPQIAGKKRKRDVDTATISPVVGPADVFCLFQPEQISPTDNVIVASDSDTGRPVKAAELLFLKEAMASHKLTEEIICEAVAGDRTLEPRAIMAHGVGRSGDIEYHEYWFAAVCAQTYTSMIDKGLRYGIISTGALYVFLSIDPDDLSTLRYSLCRASLDVAVSPLMRIVSLALIAMQHGSLPANDHLDSIRDGRGLIWTTATASFSTADSPDLKIRAGTESWRSTSAQTSNDGSSSISNQPSDADENKSTIDRERAITSLVSTHVDAPPRGCDGARSNSPRPSRPPPLLHAHSTAVEAQRLGFLYPSPPPQDESILGKRYRQDDLLNDAKVSAQPAKRTKTDNDTSFATSLPMQNKRIQDRDFCTQKCLLSLKIGSDGLRPPADGACPNHADHQSIANLTYEQLCQNLRAQLTMRGNGAPSQFDLGYQFLLSTSGHTQMIKLCLNTSGHVVLAKGFVPSELGAMRREAGCYAHLRRLQGKYVPVCTGTVELPHDKALLYDGFRFTGLILLGWAGTEIGQWHLFGGGLGYGGEADHAFVRALTVEVRKAVAEIHKAGVLHGDVALRNVLLRRCALKTTSSGPEWRLQVTIIDFELSRSRSMYEREETRRLRGRPHTRDMRQEFSEALAKEMDKCADAISKWCPRG